MLLVLNNERVECYKQRTNKPGEDLWNKRGKMVEVLVLITN